MELTIHTNQLISRFYLSLSVCFYLVEVLEFRLLLWIHYLP